MGITFRSPCESRSPSRGREAFHIDAVLDCEQDTLEWWSRTRWTISFHSSSCSWVLQSTCPWVEDRCCCSHSLRLGVMGSTLFRSEALCDLRYSCGQEGDRHPG